MSDDEKLDKKKSKDIWDIFDLVGNLVSSILISGVLGYFIQKGVQEISFSIETGKLTQSLISDLSTTKKEDQLRQDIALAALDASIGDKRPELVANVAERIASSKSNADDTTAKYALDVLKSRDFKRYQEIVDRRSKLIESSTSKSQASSTPQSSPPASAIKPTEQVKAISQTIARTFDGIVFIQYRDSSQKRQLEATKAELSKQGLEVPDFEQVGGEYSNSIRYFNKEDASLATQIKSIVDSAYNRNGRSFEILDYSNSGYKIPKGQIEIWAAN